MDNIVSNQELLLAELPPHIIDIMDWLYSKYVISADFLRAGREETSDNVARVLIQLHRRGPTAVKHFCDALKYVGRWDIASNLSSK